MEESRATGQGGGLAAGLQGLTASLLSAVLLVLCFPPFNLAEAAYVFAVPLLLVALFGIRSKGEDVWLFLSGWLAWTAILFWLRNFTRHLDIPLAGLVGWLALLALAAVMAVFWWAWWRIALAVVRRAREQGLAARLAALLGLAAWWIVLEWIRGNLFTGFPWAPLAASQWQRPLILQIASVTGGAGVGFVLVGFNLGLSFYLHNLWVQRRGRWWRRLSPEFYTALALLFAAIGFGLHSAGAGERGRQAGPRLAFVQPDAGAVEKWDMALMEEHLGVLRDLTVYAGYLGAGLVLWPESPTPLPVKGNASMRDWVESLSREVGLPLLIGNVAREGAPDDPDRRWFNAVFFVDPESGLQADSYYAKRRLVPFGEYVPMARFLPFLRKVVPSQGEFYPGTSAAPLVHEVGDAGEQAVGVLVCYEDIFPALARANTRAGADWHFVATNNVWYGREAGAWQHAAHSVLRAVETRRPVVRCGNAGWSGWIDEFGHVRHAMVDENASIYFQGVEAVDFSLSRYWSGRLSPYVRYGEWFTGTCLLLCLLSGVVLQTAPPRRRGGAGDRPRGPLAGLRGGRGAEA